MNVAKLSKIILFSLLGISIIIMLMFYFGGYADVAKEIPNFTGLALNWAIVLFFITLIVALAFFVFRIISDPKGSFKSILGLILLIVIFLISWALGSGEKLDLPDYTGPDNVYSKLKLAGMMLYTSLILFIGVFIAIILSEIIKRFRN